VVRTARLGFFLTSEVQNAMTAVPVLPESAPFTPSQRAWLNGFFTGMLNLDTASIGATSAPVASADAPAPAVKEDFPWHDPELALVDRLKLAEGRPPDRVMMAAMAQLDCGACGYFCKTYAEAVARGEETDLTKCSPGGRETARKLKELVAAKKPSPTITDPGYANGNGHVAASGPAKPNGAVATGEKPAYGLANPFRAPLLKSESLNRPGSAKDVRMVAFSLKGSGLSYEVGDALGVIPENDPELVEAIIEAMGARGDECVPIPGGGSIHLYEALTDHYVITKVGDDFAALMAAHATIESEAATLRTLIEDDAEGIPAHWDVLDVLEQFPSARPPLTEMVGALSSLQPRLYSISSSLKAFPDEVHLTVGVVRYEQGGRSRRGVASNFLAETLRPRRKASVFVHSSPGFRLPADGDAPVVMIGPGTGVAPFRAFLQERAASGAKGRNWLFFGDQQSETDFLYRDEIEAYRTDGLLTRLDLAFSRDQAEKVYVQHRMLESADELWSWLEDGAHVYVCGDPRRMALDVDFALREIVAEKGRMSADAAKDYLKTMSQTGRYQRDVY
jgi:sulfite reductase (NADPH) flavoprotein alpha-component